MPVTANKQISAKTEGWAGGVNMRDALNQLAANQARRMENGVLDERGGFGKRLGMQSQGTFGVAGDRIISQHIFYRGTAAPQILIHTSAGKLYYTSNPLIVNAFPPTSSESFIWPAKDASGYGANVTLSGNEITDTLRALGVQGDGRLAPDSSVGIWAATTNLVLNGGAETNITGWNGYSGATVARDLSRSKFGVASVLVTPSTPNTGGGPGVTVLAATQYTYSAWVYSPTGGTYYIQLTDGIDQGLAGPDTIVPAGVWTRVVATGTTDSHTARNLWVFSRNDANPFYMDGAQVEAQATATPYVHTDGATATRAAAVVTAPSSVLSGSQGWFAARVRWAVSPAVNANIASWGVTANDRLGLTWIAGTTSLHIGSVVGGVVQPSADVAVPGGVAGTFTVIGCWTATGVKISVNGAPFVSVVSLVPPIAGATFNIGSRADTGGNQLGGDVLWFAAGTGTLTDTDDSVINSFGNTDPTLVDWTQIATGLSTTVPMSFETFNSLCFFSNGVDAYASWDGSAYVTYPTAPKGKFLRLWKDTMWMSGVSGAGFQDRVYSSAPGDATTFPVAAWVDIAKGDGDAISALGTDGLFLITFKLRRYMSIYDPVTFANRVVDYEKGCESHFSIVQFESTIYFLSRRGFCKYVQDTPGEFISLNLDPLFDPAILNLNALSGAWAYTVGNRIGWCLPEAGSTYNTIQVEYYPRLGPLSPYGFRQIGPFAFHRMPAQNFVRWRYGADERLFGGSNLANKYYWAYAPVGTDDGVPFTALLETPAYDFGDSIRTKYLRRIRFLGRGRFIFQIKPNYGTAVSKTFPVDLTSTSNVWNSGNWNVGTWGPDSIFKSKRLQPDAYGRAFSLVFIDAEIGTGRTLTEVGSREYATTQGEWALYGVWLEGALLGVRD